MNGQPRRARRRWKQGVRGRQVQIRGGRASVTPDPKIWRHPGDAGAVSQYVRLQLTGPDTASAVLRSEVRDHPSQISLRRFRALEACFGTDIVPSSPWGCLGYDPYASEACAVLRRVCGSSVGYLASRAVSPLFFRVAMSVLRTAVSLPQ